MIWSEMTAAAHQAVDREIPVVVPVGSIEQHGPHLPVVTDAFLAGHFAALLHRDLHEQVLVLPTVMVGMSEHHMEFAGTLTVDHRSLFDYLEGILDSVAQHGYVNVLLLNAHGGNQGVATAVVERFGRRHPGCRVAFTSWWTVAAPELLALSDSGPGGVGHACELETSLMLHAAPSLVEAAAIRDPEPSPVPGWAAGDMLRAARAQLYRTSREWSNAGIFGRPESATAEKGAKAERAIVAQLGEVVRTMAQA